MEENGRTRSPAGHMAMWRAAWRRPPTFFRPVSGLTTSGWPPSRSVPKDWISGCWPALRTTHGACVRGRLPLRGQHRLARSDISCMASAPGSLFPVELRPLRRGPASTWNVRECREFQSWRQCGRSSCRYPSSDAIKLHGSMPIVTDGCNFRTQRRRRAARRRTCIG